MSDYCLPPLGSILPFNGKNQIFLKSIDICLRLSSANTSVTQGSFLGVSRFPCFRLMPGDQCQFNAIPDIKTCIMSYSTCRCHSSGMRFLGLRAFASNKSTLEQKLVLQGFYCFLCPNKFILYCPQSSDTPVLHHEAVHSTKMPVFCYNVVWAHDEPDSLCA